jgi:hypothetical protein
MLSPVMVGWAFRLRYQTLYVLLAGLTYTVSQPFAYAALFTEVFIPEHGQAVLAALAMLKLGWGVTAMYYAGIAPLSTETLIRLPRKTTHQKPALAWRGVILAAVLVDGAGIAWVMKVRGMAMLDWIWGIMAGVAVLVAFLAALRKIAEWLQHWLGRANDGDDAR